MKQKNLLPPHVKETMYSRQTTITLHDVSKCFLSYLVGVCQLCTMKEIVACRFLLFTLSP